jgi:hypothetical protein
MAEGLALRGAKDGTCTAVYRQAVCPLEFRESQYNPKHIGNMSDKTCIAVRALERYTVGRYGSR